MKINNYISCDPRICGGDPVFKGTMIPVYLVLDLIQTVPQLDLKNSFFDIIEGKAKF
jgi:uncharacterized protein (DUF433 family)